MRSLYQHRLRPTLRSVSHSLVRQGQVAEAGRAYSLGLKEADDSQLKAVLYSNRAACYLKSQRWQDCIDDCTSALDLAESNAIRGKVLYRRAKARFLLSEGSSEEQLLNDAAIDLLTLLSIDKNNKDATSLLQTIRAKHSLQKGTPISKTLKELPSNPDHSCKVLLGLLTNDPSCAMELGRLHGIPILVNQQTALSLQVVACASSYPPFVHTYAATQLSQSDLADIVDNRSMSADVRMAVLSIWLRLVMYLDKESLIDGPSVVRTCRAALQAQEPRLMQASIEILSSWTSMERDSPKKTEAELRAMRPREVSAYKKQEYEEMTQNKKRVSDCALLFCKQGGLDTLLEASVHCLHGNVLRREMGVVLGRLFGSILDADDIKTVVKPLLLCGEGVTIEEIHTDFDEKDEEHEPLEAQMKRAQLTISLLLGVPEVGVWALSRVDGINEVRDLIRSGDRNAMYMASELVSAAASVEQARSLLVNLPLDDLLQSDDCDIRSGAASALAKLGLADKTLSANEGEMMGLLQASVQLLYGVTPSELDDERLSKIKSYEVSTKPTTAIERGIEVLSYLASKTQVKEELAHGFRASLDSPSTALERLVELACAPNAGESLSAFGLATIFALMAVSFETLRREAFAGKDITMEQYDELQALSMTKQEKSMEPSEAEDTPAAVQERIRRMASADVPRAMVKLMNGASDSTVEQIIVGLNRMASEASVRGLIVQQGALSACIKVERGVRSRFIMSVIVIVYNTLTLSFASFSQDNPSESGKNILRQARHCIAKLLVTTNPNLLTSSQQMGSIKPLIQLIRDNDSTDFQQFEALLAITNLASTGDETKEHIVAEKGISTLSYAMFSDHKMVRRAGTEAMCNLVPHPAMMEHLADPEHLRLWLAFASDVEGNFECSRAASGCLAMSTYDPLVAKTLVDLKSFRESMTMMLECGNLEVMHRVLVIILNLVEQGGECREATISAGLVAFCAAYVASYHDGRKADELHFSTSESERMAVSVDIAKQIVRLAD